MSRLFTDEFLRAAAHLRIIARQVPAGGRHAEQRSRDCGAGLEFRDFRSYVPGDDLRRVDWNIYRRSGRIFLRLFEQPEDLPVHVLLDVSDSMYFETPPRADAARQLAGLVAAISAGQADRTTIWPIGAELGVPRPVAGGQHGLHAALDYIESLEPAGRTNLAGAIGKFAALGLRRGLAVVISDFFDPRGVDSVLAALSPVRHRLVLVQVTRPSDGEPAAAGEVTVVDCETGAEIELTMSTAAQRAYRDAYAAFCDRVMAFAARRRAAHLRLDAERPVLEQVSGLLHEGVLVA